MKIYIGSDHAGYKIKEELKPFIEKIPFGYEVFDLGPKEYDLKFQIAEEKIREKQGELILKIGKEKSDKTEQFSQAFEGFLALEGKKIFGEETEIIPASRFDD